MRHSLALLFAAAVFGVGVVSASSCDAGCEGLDLCSCATNSSCVMVPKAGGCACGINGLSQCAGYDGQLCKCFGEYDHCEAVSQGGW